MPLTFQQAAEHLQALHDFGCALLTCLPMRLYLVLIIVLNKKIIIHNYQLDACLPACVSYTHICVYTFIILPT